MAAPASRMRRRRWADIVVIIASAYAIGAAAWFPPELVAGGENEAVRDPPWLWTAYAVAGVLGFAAVFVASRSSKLGRALVLIAALVMVASFFTLGRITPLAVLSIGITALALLAAAPFMGRMPTATEEARANAGPGTEPPQRP